MFFYSQKKIIYLSKFNQGLTIKKNYIDPCKYSINYSKHVFFGNVLFIWLFFLHHVFLVVFALGSPYKSAVNKKTKQRKDTTMKYEISYNHTQGFLIEPVQLTLAGLSKAIRYILENLNEELTLDLLEQISGISRFALIRQFKKKFGISPMKWIWRLRTALAAKLLECSDNGRIIDVAIICGFSSQAHLSRLVKAYTGKTPLEIRTNNKVDSEEDSAKFLLDAFALAV